MGSERLPGKVLLDLTNGKKTIDFLFEQLKSSKLKKKIVAIPENNEDDILFEHLKNSKIPCFRGSSLDVLDRFYRCGISGKKKAPHMTRLFYNKYELI